MSCTNRIARISAPIFLLLAYPAAAAPAESRLLLPAPDVAAVLALDAQPPEPRPYRFAVPIGVTVAPHTHGTWQSAAGLARWQLAVNAPGAQHLNLAFGQYALPVGAKLTIRSVDGLDRRGPYDHRINARGELWTPVVRGDTAIVELEVADAHRAGVRLELTRVNYGFRGFGAKDTTEPKSGACNVDVACDVADEWRNDLRSVARISISGAFLCSGQLMNNAAQDFRPYFLTAAHCLSTEAQARTTNFYWNYETSTCGGRTDGRLDQVSSGSTLRAASAVESLAAPQAASDFALLELLETPPAEFRVYYAGWDRRDIAPLGVVGLHHPSGDEKRISFEFDQTEIAAYASSPTATRSQHFPTHLRIADWDLGTTEGGSSGSGIWNKEHRLVGQLSGGSAACGNNSPDWYGRFYSNWHDVPTPVHSVAFWLDPEGTGAEVLDGADPNGLDFVGGEPKRGALAQALGGALTLPALLLLAAVVLLRGHRR